MTSRWDVAAQRPMRHLGGTLNVTGGANSRQLITRVAVVSGLLRTARSHRVIGRFGDVEIRAP